MGGMAVQQNGPAGPRTAHVETKGGDLSDVAILWLGDSHAKRAFMAIPDNPAVTVAYAWLAFQPGWEETHNSVVAQVADCGAAPRVFLSLGSRMLTVTGMKSTEVKVVLLEITKRWFNQGIPVTIMELPFGADRQAHLEVWRTSCLIRGMNSLLLGSSPAAGLMMATVTTRGDQSSALGLGPGFPMRRDSTKFADQVHLKDPYYAEVAEEVLREFSDNTYEDPKAPWKVEAGQVVSLVTPPGLQDSWDQFLQGERSAEEVQLWNEEELYSAPQQPLHQLVSPQWQQWGQQQWGRYHRARGHQGGYRGRGRRGRRGGYAPGDLRQRWHGSRADRRMALKNYNFH